MSKTAGRPFDDTGEGPAPALASRRHPQRRRSAMKVLVMIKGDGADEDKVAPTDEMFAVMNVYNEQLVNAGIMLGGEGLQPSSDGREGRVRTERRGRRSSTGRSPRPRRSSPATGSGRSARSTRPSSGPSAARRPPGCAPCWRSGRSSRWRTSRKVVSPEIARRRSRRIVRPGLEDASDEERGDDRRATDRRGHLADRVAAAHRLAHPPGPGRRAGRGARAGRVRRGAGAVADRPASRTSPARG